MNRCAAVSVVLALSFGGGVAALGGPEAEGPFRAADPQEAPSRPPLPPTMAAHQRFAREAISGERAREIVAFMDRFYRVPGNEPFNASLGRVVEVLEAAGYVEEGVGAGARGTASAGAGATLRGGSEAAPGGAGGTASGGQAASRGTPPLLTYRLERRPLDNPTWEPVAASLVVAGQSAPLLTLESNLNLVAANSFSTPSGGVEAELVDVGSGSAADFEGKDVRGKVVMADASVGQLFRRAVLEHGALGVLAFRLSGFNRPEVNRDIAPMSSISYDAEAEAWGLLLTANARDALRRALAAGPVRVRVGIETRIYPSEELTLVAEVRGRREPERRFVFSAHVQESGANDNATGVAALAEIARAFGEGVRSGAFVPERTLTMIWGDEISSTRRYLQEDPERAGNVGWGVSLDMVGEDTSKTGGTFLIEKMPDPSAVWTRGEDRHTEWGGRPMGKEQLTPHYLNDLVLNRCLDQAAGTGWVVKTNPYEGGSDHVPFLQAGAPGLLLWHFTDQFYHTDGDRIDKVSATTLENVGVCAATTAMALTTADGPAAFFLLEELERAALERIGREGALSRAAVAAGGEVESEREILETWTSWYLDALGATQDIPVGGPSPAFLARLEDALERVAAEGEAAVEGVGRGS